MGGGGGGRKSNKRENRLIKEVIIAISRSSVTGRLQEPILLLNGHKYYKIAFYRSDWLVGWLASSLVGWAVVGWVGGWVGGLCWLGVGLVRFGLVQFGMVREGGGGGEELRLGWGLGECLDSFVFADVVIADIVVVWLVGCFFLSFLCCCCCFFVVCFLICSLVCLFLLAWVDGWVCVCVCGGGGGSAFGLAFV